MKTSKFVEAQIAFVLKQAKYGDWVVQEMRRAQNLGCDFSNAREWLEPRRYLNWCLGQTEATMRN